MNSLMFMVDINDYILKCIYYENSKDGKRKEIEINLPDSKLHDVFFEMVKMHPKTEPFNFEAANIFNFYNVDINMINTLINESKRQQKSIPSSESKKEPISNKQKWVSYEPLEMSSKSQEIPIEPKKISYKPEKNIKVKRVNKFKKTIAITSTSILAALSIFMFSKEAMKNIDFSRDPFPLSYTDEVENKYTIIDKMKDTGSEIISFKDNTLDKIETFKDIVGWNDSEKTKSDNEKENVESKNIKEKNIEIPVESVGSNPIESIQENISTESSIVPDEHLRIYADSMIDSEKYKISKAYYFETLSGYANQYRVPPILALAIATHERGKHSDQVDPGGAIGIFQIQVEGGWNWDNKTIRAYNFETNNWDEMLITKDSASDVFINMQIGCMMLQNLLETYDYNVAEAVTAYNYGTENVRHVLETCSENTGLSMDELNDINNMDWLQYRNIIKGGDPEYLENVFKYIPDGTMLSFTKPNNEVINIEFDNLTYQNTKDISNTN